MAMAGPPLIGGVRPAPPVIIQMPDGQKFSYPQAMVAGIADPVVAQLAAYIANFAITNLLQILESEGVIPAGTLQRYQSPVQSGEPPASKQDEQHDHTEAT